MSTKSKTGAKLVDSIRKSKTGAVASKTSQRPDSGDSTSRSKPAAARSTTKTATNKKTSTAATDQDRSKLFSHSRRVWPD